MVINPVKKIWKEKISGLTCIKKNVDFSVLEILVSIYHSIYNNIYTIPAETLVEVSKQYG